LASLAADPNLAQHLTASNASKIKDYLYSFTTHRDRPDRTSISGTDGDRIFDSDNHDMHTRSVYWITAQLLKDDPAYANHVFPGGDTAEQRYSKWTMNLLNYFQQRAGKGGTVEVGSPVYAATYARPVFHVAAYAEDDRLKTIAREYLDLHFADLAQETIEGMRGGTKVRAYKNRVLSAGNERSIQYLWPFTGAPAEGMDVVPLGAHLPRTFGGAMTTDYRVRQEIIDMLNNDDARGEYTYTTNRMGEGARTTELGEIVNIPSAGQSALLRTTRVNPDYALGWFTIDETKSYMAISSQSQAMAVVTDASRTSRLVINLTGGKSYNELQAVGDGDAMLVRRQTGRYVGEKPRVYVSNDFDYNPVQEADGWVFGTDNAGSFFAIKGMLSAGWDTYTRADASSDLGNGYYLTFDDDDTVVVLQMGRASDYADLDAFKADIRDNPLTYDSGQNAVVYNPGAAGGELTLYNSKTLPKVNGQTVDLTPTKVYNSPYLNADYGSKTIAFTDLDGNTFDLDFNSSPIAPTQYRSADADIVLNDTFSPGYRGMVGETDVSPSASHPGGLTYTIGSTGVLEIDLDARNDVVDKLIVDGTLALGGTFRVNMIDGSPTVPGTYDVIDATTITGDFDVYELSELGSGLLWKKDNLKTTGVMELIRTENVILVGDKDDFSYNAATDAVAVEADWAQTFLTELPFGEHYAFDQAGANENRLATFYLGDLGPVSEAWIEMRVKEQGSTPDNDSLRLDDFTNSHLLSSFEIVEGANTAGTSDTKTLVYRLAADELAYLADGILNVGITDDHAVDWMTFNWISEPVVLLGDVDGDGDVDNVDIGIVTGNFTGTGGSGMAYADGDVDGDGDVDNVDIGIVTGAFTGAGAFGSVPTVEGAVVPEPATLVLLGLGGLLLAGRR
jgi:hypothetical protein